MLSIDHSAATEVQVSPARCLNLLGAVERYPGWASLISSAELVGGDPYRVRLRAEVMGIGFEMECTLALTADRAVMSRLPNDANDRERYEALWMLRAGGGSETTEVELHVAATLDAPRAASVMRGTIERKLVDDLVADFQRAAEAPERRSPRHVSVTRPGCSGSGSAS